MKYKVKNGCEYLDNQSISKYTNRLENRTALV